jgi:hypothetical protein
MYKYDLEQNVNLLTHKQLIAQAEYHFWLMELKLMTLPSYLMALPRFSKLS